MAPGRLCVALGWLLCGSWAALGGLDRSWSGPGAVPGVVMGRSWTVLVGLGAVLGQSWGGLGAILVPSLGQELFGYSRPKKPVNRPRPLGSF